MNATLNIVAAGNHQTYALDIGFLVEGLLSQAGIMPRGLAHPVIFEVRQCGHVMHMSQTSALSSHCVEALMNRFTLELHAGRWQPGFWQLHADIWRGEGRPYQLFQARTQMYGALGDYVQTSTGHQAHPLACLLETMHVPCRLMKNKESVLLYPGGVREVTAH
jgi:hypothetical protein